MKTTLKLSSNVRRPQQFKIERLAKAFCAVLATAGVIALANQASADNVKSNRAFNKPGNLLIADQFNNRVIRVNQAKQIVASYGLPLAGGDPIGNNVGYDLQTTQKGLYSPYDAKVVGDYTGLTPPFGFNGDDKD